MIEFKTRFAMVCIGKGIGQNGSVYGYNNKYLKMAKYINLQYGCTIVVSSNPYDCTDSLGQALEVIKQEVNQDVNVYYMGMSNGAILGARFGHLHSEIKRMLLINGPLMINWPKTKKGLEKFEGESVVMVYGSLDPSFKYAEINPTLNIAFPLKKLMYSISVKALS